MVKSKQNSVVKHTDYWPLMTAILNLPTEVRCPQWQQLYLKTWSNRERRGTSAIHALVFRNKLIWWFYNNDLLSGESSPSKRILNLIPTAYSWLRASWYLFSPMMNWLILKEFNKVTHKKPICQLKTRTCTKPWLVNNNEKCLSRNSMRCRGKHS